MIAGKPSHSRKTMHSDHNSHSKMSLFYIPRSVSYSEIIPKAFNYNLKFPKGKSVRQQTSKNTLLETSEPLHRSTVKNFEVANKTTLNQNQQHRRISKSGVFKPTSQHLLNFKEQGPNPQTVESSACYNKRALWYSKFKDSDPILNSKVERKQTNVNPKVHDSARRQRDNGLEFKDTILNYSKMADAKKSFYRVTANDQNTPQKENHLKQLLF